MRIWRPVRNTQIKTVSLLQKEKGVTADQDGGSSFFGDMGNFQNFLYIYKIFPQTICISIVLFNKCIWQPCDDSRDISTHEQYNDQRNQEWQDGLV